MRQLSVRIAKGAAIAATMVSLLATLATPAQARTLSLTGSPSIGVWGTTFIFRGFTDPNISVKLQRRFVGEGTWRDVSSQSKTSGDSGYFWFGDQPVANADYRAITPDDNSISTAVRINVRVGISISASSSGQRAVFTGRVLPVHPGTRVILQEYDGGNRVWNNVAGGSLSSGSYYRVAMSGPRSGRRIFRVTWPTQDQSHAWNISGEVGVTWVAS